MLATESNSTAALGDHGADVSSSSSSSSNIQVFCRVRPQNAMEKRAGAVDCSSILEGKTICIHNEDAETDTTRFTFDRVFETHSSQQEVYQHTAKPLIQSFLDGFNCTIFAYGQTGSGKTHTILGPRDGQASAQDQGIISRLTTDLHRAIDQLQQQQHHGVHMDLQISILEIYMEQIRDLLQSNPPTSAAMSPTGGLKIRENAQKGVYVEEMTQLPCDNEAVTNDIIRTGHLNRAVSSTRMNKDSSRSHCIVMLQATRREKARVGVVKKSTMFIVDLAGSEFVNKTLASGKVLQEAKSINKSLSALSNVIKALVEGKKHIPYRDSKLTRLLQDSLGGSSKTCLILAVSSSSYNLSETISTLRFGLRAKEIKNTVALKPDQLSLSANELRELYQSALAELEKKDETIEELQQQLLLEKTKLPVSPEPVVPVAMIPAPAAVIVEPAIVPAVQVEIAQNSIDAVKPAVEKDESVTSDEHSEVSMENEALETLVNELNQQKAVQTQLETEILVMKEDNLKLHTEIRAILESYEVLRAKTSCLIVDTATGKAMLRLKQDVADSPTLFEWLEVDKMDRVAEVLAVEEDLPLQDGRENTVSFEADGSGQMESSTDHETLEKSLRRCSSSFALKSDHNASMASIRTQEPDDRDHEIEDSTEPLVNPSKCVNESNGKSCVHRLDAEKLSRKIVELKLRLHYLSENARLSMNGEQYEIVEENTELKARIQELECECNLANVKCNQLSMKNEAYEARLSNQEGHISSLENSLQEYQGLFNKQIIMSQEKCRLLSDELHYYRRLSNTQLGEEEEGVLTASTSS